MASLDSQIDALYQKPLDEFTSARNALAKTLTGTDASRIRKLPKPTLVPWAVNQLYWQARPVFDRLRTTGERLRGAQIAALKGRAADLRGASDAQRKAIADAVQQATALSGQAGSHPNPDELTRTLEALSLAPELPEPPGRLTRPLQPAGFEALAGVPIRSAPAGSRPAKAEGPARKGPAKAGHDVPPPGPEVRSVRLQADVDRGGRSVRLQADRDAKERRERQQAERRAQAELHRAEAMLDRAKAAQSQARAAWERTNEQVQAAERAVERARRTLKP